MALLKKLTEFVENGPPSQTSTYHGSREAAADLVKVDIVGESSYQKELGQLAGPKLYDGVSKWLLASLTPDPANPYDENAVAVSIQGFKVGYLARPMAKAFQHMMISAGMAGEDLTEIDAEIRGGWSRGNDEGHFGVALYLPESVAKQLGVT
ncbi:MAG: hypothetical protein GEU75_12540 [Dehalococcoidia bacterium]|nr:hypothetical protein [Dehalococcoidia bacterium]